MDIRGRKENMTTITVRTYVFTRENYFLMLTSRDLPGYEDTLVAVEKTSDQKTIRWGKKTVLVSTIDGYSFTNEQGVELDPDHPDCLIARDIVNSMRGADVSAFVVDNTSITLASQETPEQIVRYALELLAVLYRALDK